MIHQIAHILATDSVTSDWYAFWSGFANILERFAELFVIGGILLYHHNCHQPGCLWLGKYPAAEGGGWKYCKKHHKTGGVHV